MHQPKKFFISLFIMLVIGLHALPLLQRLGDERQTFWPFMAWGMYKYSLGSPVYTEKIHTIGITTRGEEGEILPGDIGLSRTVFALSYLKPMRKGDASAAQRLADRLNRNRDEPIVELRVESERYTVTNSGIVKETNPAVIYRVVN